MDRLAYFAVSTSGLVVSFLVGAIWVWRRHDSATAKRFLLTAAVSYTLASVYAFPAAAGRLLSVGYHRFAPDDVPRGGDVAVVLLAAGADTIVGWEGRITVMKAVEAARVIEAWRVFQAIAPRWIVSSGGSRLDPHIATPGGLTMREELVRMGVPEDRILVETRSLTTHDEAVIVAPMLRSLGVAHVVLVTSDAHMRRSLGAFRTQGWSAVPAIAPDPGLAGTWFEWVVPSGEGLVSSSVVVHELLGLPYYWLRGWWRF